ncbi:sulfotransferase domain-containing protein [Planktomarina temperata]|nr:sulfotransferase domain-containing protein [Planktomarina temperata]
MLQTMFKRKSRFNRYDDDLFIVEFPKSGVTWLTNILSNIIYAKNDLSIEPNFFNVGDIVCDIHTQKAEFHRKLEFPGFHIYKSHEAYNPTYKKVIYLWRDPMQCLRSYYRMLVGLGEYDGSFSEFIAHPDYGVEAWCSHVESWIFRSSMQQRMIFLEYEKLTDNSLSEILNLTSNLGWNVTEELVQVALDKSSMKNMTFHENQRFMSDPRWAIRVSKSYRFVGNKTNIETSKIDERYVTERSTQLVEELKNYAL